jgi:hypothetical protein
MRNPITKSGQNFQEDWHELSHMYTFNAFRARNA